jgi:hypothetical protein
MKKQCLKSLSVEGWKELQLYISDFLWIKFKNSLVLKKQEEIFQKITTFKNLKTLTL